MNWACAAPTGPARPQTKSTEHNYLKEPGERPNARRERGKRELLCLHLPDESFQPEDRAQSKPQGAAKTRKRTQFSATSAAEIEKSRKGEGSPEFRV